MAAATTSGGRRNSSAQLLEELEALSHSLYTAHTSSNRRTASLVLPRTSIPPILTDDVVPTKPEPEKPITKSRRRLSLSPWRSRPKLDEDISEDTKISISNSPKAKLDYEKDQEEKKGIWKWKPIRAISHIGKQKLSCLFSVEVVAAQGLPSSMNGLRLSVCVRKKETKDGAVQTMPSRVSQGAADFEETLFVKCHVYGNSGNGKNKMKFEPRPFWIYLFAVDAGELDFGKNSVDLTNLIQESMEKSFEGTRIRQWDVSFNLAGKAKGGELVLKLGFQIMEKDGGTTIYNQEPSKSSKSSRFLSTSSFARKQSKTSFSVPSPRMSGRSEAAWSPSDTGRSVADLQGIDDLNLDEPAPAPAPQLEKKETDELDLPDFEVVDKGVEITEEATAEEERESEAKSASSEVVKEMLVVDELHQARLSELDSIAKQIKALESMMGEDKSIKGDEETDSQRLDADEDAVTREFLQLLEEEEEEDEFKLDPPDINPPLQLDEAKDSASADDETKVYIPDLGKGLGCVVQTRDGGYLAAMNPLDTSVLRKDMPKLAMQISKPLVLPSDKSISGFELLQRMAGDGIEELTSRILSLMPMDELMGKTAEQIAFEGIASAIIQGRNKEGASSTAARTIAAVKTMAAAMNTGRKERISSGIWNVNENPLTAEEILAFSLQKIEAMSIDALKVQAEMPEEEAPFSVSPMTGNDQDHPLTSSVPLEDWIKNYGLNSSETALGDPAALTLAVVVQLRDPIRRYEAVGGPTIAIIQAVGGPTIAIKTDDQDEDKRFKTASLHVGGLKIRTVKKKNAWDTEKQRLTAMQWLVAYGLVKAGKRGKQAPAKGQDLLWSLSSRVMADMWLKAMRNPDVKFAK